MLIGSRVGAELVVINRDPTGKRVVARCSACGATMVVGTDALATGAARCGCRPLTLQEREALRASQRDLEAHREQREWRPGR
jgi:hypothetical protein